MGRLIDETGNVYGRLTVIGLSGRDSHNHPLWECFCECGGVCYTTGNRLRSGNTSSCGCIHKEQLIRRNTKHGGSKNRLYMIYKGMKDRCMRPNNHDFADYGGRGIKICDAWLGDHGFETFAEWANKNGYSDCLSIDRADVNGNYDPDNCRWVDAVAQANNKRNNHFIEWNGAVHTISEWAKLTGIPARTIEARIRVLGWDAEKTLTVKGGRFHAC